MLYKTEFKCMVCNTYIDRSSGTPSHITYWGRCICCGHPSSVAAEFVRVLRINEELEEFIIDLYESI